MTQDWIYTGILTASFLVLFGIAELLFHFLKVKAELTRKLVHVGTGALTLLFPVLLNNHWLVLLLCISFAVILICSLRWKLLPSINAIDRVSIGSLAYPVSVYCCYLLFDSKNQDFVWFYAPILILAICDPIAALMGKRFPIGRYTIGSDTKTLMGSGMFLLSAVIVYCALVVFLSPGMTVGQWFWSALLVSVFSCVAEAFSGKGTDNLTIPAAVALALLITETH